MKKRGLSDVVTTVLIILLVLAAVAIIWGYLRNTLTQSGSQITSSCLTLDLAPKSCSNNASGTSFSYGRNAGDGNLQAVSLIFTVNGNTKVINATQVPKALESYTTYLVNSTLGGNATSFTVAGTVLTESGTTKLCPQAQPISCS